MFLQLFLCVSIFFGFKPLLACEQEVTDVKVQLGTMTRCSLYYAGSSFVESCCAAGIMCGFSTPFLNLNCPLEQFEDFNPINALPVTLFEDKKKGDELCTLDRPVTLKCAQVCSSNRSDKRYRLILDSELDKLILQRQLDTFRTFPNYFLKNEKELLKIGVIERTSAGKIIHGEKGYFKDEIQQKRRYKYLVLFSVVGVVSFLCAFKIFLRR